ncbi:MAG TPA: hypothetical protein VHL34_08180 [Rhizomicrobium sp.]|jgi:hypothetical protein|nr:hypothetical protein [Rhizomicrobium sp.]
MNALLRGLRKQKSSAALLGALLLLPVGVWLLMPGEGGPEIDHVTMCPIGPLDAHRIVLIDATDQLGPTQRDILIDALQHEAEDTTTYEKFTLAAVDDLHPFEPHILFSRCAPKRKSQGPSENPYMLKAIWDKDFYNPMLKSLDPALKGADQKETPLIESIFGLARRPDFGVAVPHRRLVIVSDMLQNTKALYSQYSDRLTFEAFAEKPQAFQSVPDLTGVTVVNRFLDRRVKRCIQGFAQRRFWEAYFSHAGTSIAFDNWPWRRPDRTLEDRCTGSDVQTAKVRKHKKHRHRLPPRPTAVE